MFTVLTLYFFYKGGGRPPKAAQQRLRRWFWTTAIGSRYTGRGYMPRVTRAIRRLTLPRQRGELHGPAAIDLDALRSLVPNQQRMKAIVTRHTTLEQAAAIFSKVSPRLAVFSHSPETAGIVQQTMRFYSRPVKMGTDLMVIDIGDQVRVRPVAAAAARR